MKKKFLLFGVVLLGAGNLAYAETIHNQVTLTNSTPKQGPMTVMYRVLENSSVANSQPGAPVTAFVGESTTINLTNSDSQTITVVPVSVNGHAIPMNQDVHANVRKVEACAVTLDAQHGNAKISFREVTKPKGGSYLSCSTEGGLTA